MDATDPLPSVGIVVITRDRVSVLLEDLCRLVPLVPSGCVVVVDNASTDGTADLVRRRFPSVRVVTLPRNAGAAARNVGARHLDTTLVAFNDDDSWWAGGALERAQACFRRHPRLGLLGARVVVEPHGTTDPVSVEMARSPLGTEPDLPGPSVLGFVACGVVVRRAAFLDVGGFHERFGIGAEERLLSIDLTAAGWGLSYVGSVVAHHAPGHAAGGRQGRRATAVRDRLWTTALRGSRNDVLAELLRCIRAAARDAKARRGLVLAFAGGPWILRERRMAPATVRLRLAMLDAIDREDITMTQAATTEAVPGLAEALETGLSRHLAAIAARDIDAFAATIAPDPVVLVTGTGEVSHDRAHLIELHRDWFRSTTWSIETQTLHCRDHGGVGSCVLELHYRDVSGEGRSVHEVSILSLLFELHDGRWLMVQDQNTPRA